MSTLWKKGEGTEEARPHVLHAYIRRGGGDGCACMRVHELGGTGTGTFCAGTKEKAHDHALRKAPTPSGRQQPHTHVWLGKDPDSSSRDLLCLPGFVLGKQSVANAAGPTAHI